MDIMTNTSRTISTEHPKRTHFQFFFIHIFDNKPSLPNPFFTSLGTSFNSGTSIHHNTQPHPLSITILAFSKHPRPHTIFFSRGRSVRHFLLNTTHSSSSTHTSHSSRPSTRQHPNSPHSVWDSLYVTPRILAHPQSHYEVNKQNNHFLERAFPIPSIHSDATRRS